MEYKFKKNPEIVCPFCNAVPKDILLPEVGWYHVRCLECKKIFKVEFKNKQFRSVIEDKTEDD